MSRMSATVAEPSRKALLESCCDSDGNICDQAIEKKLFTLVCNSIAIGRLSPVRLNTQVITMLNSTHVARNSTGVNRVQCGQLPHEEKNSGRCQAPHSGPRMS